MITFEGWVGWALLAVTVAALACVVWLARRRDDATSLQALGESLRHAAMGDAQQIARELRAEVADSARATRQFFDGTATTEIYPPSLRDALPI